MVTETIKDKIRREYMFTNFDTFVPIFYTACPLFFMQVFLFLDDVYGLLTHFKHLKDILNVLRSVYRQYMGQENAPDRVPTTDNTCLKIGAILSAPEIICINKTYYMFNYKVPTNNLNGYWITPLHKSAILGREPAYCCST